MSNSGWLRGESGSLMRVINKGNGFVKFEVFRAHLYLTQHDLILETLSVEQSLSARLFPEIGERIVSVVEADKFVAKLISLMAEPDEFLDSMRVKAALSLLITYDPRVIDESLRYNSNSFSVVDRYRTPNCNAFVEELLAQADNVFRVSSLGTGSQLLLRKFLDTTINSNKFLSVSLAYGWNAQDINHLLYDVLVNISVAQKPKRLSSL